MLEVCPPYGDEHFIIVATEERSGIVEANAQRLGESALQNANKSADASPYRPASPRGMSFVNRLLTTGPGPEAPDKPETAAVANSVTNTPDDNNPLTTSGDGAAILKIRTRPR
jgi:hypothetical protein